jgi:hypothetical protein
MRHSHSSINTYLSCGQKYKYSYVDKLTSIWKGSALSFGSAMDAALNHLLLNKDTDCLEDGLKIFEQEWNSQKERSGSVTDIKNNPLITYSDSDWDEDLLWEKDIQDLNELVGENWREQLERLRNKKKAGNKFETWPESERLAFNRIIWYSLLRKGRVMVTTYFQYVLPEIAEVLDVQKHVELKGEGSPDSIHGYIDFVIRTKDGKVAVMDNKTATLEYQEDAALHSPQLTLYKTILNEMNLPYKVTHVGYVVINKKIAKNKTKKCQSCGYEAEPGTQHKTCNNQVEGKRCGGSWSVTIRPSCDFQILISEPSEKFEEDLLTNVNTFSMLVQNNVYLKNHNSCYAYNSRCSYFEICQNGKSTDDSLKKKE